MTYFADGTAYSYLPEAAGDGIINIGWLDAAMPFPIGEAPPAFVDRLIALGRDGVHRTRGLHFCNLCPASESAFPEPTEVHSPDGDYPVGGAEIRVAGPAETVFAAPDMVVHYVTEHSYRPPDAFIEAVLASGRS
jgi:hypothetical protein